MNINNKEHLNAMARLIDELAHDYNNIIAIIVGYSDLLKNQNNDDKTTKYIDPILTASDRAIELSDHLLSFSRQNFKETEIIQINDCLNDLVPEIKSFLADEVNFDLCLDQDVGCIKVDVEDFKMMVLNIVRNANDAITSNGEFAIKVFNKCLDSEHANAMGIQDGDYIVLEFRDNGKGISADMQARIFDPMYSAKTEKGAGMGLSQAYGFTQRAKGSIACVSDLGEGSVFRIHLPKITS